jgi:type VI protein secretion system component Hcp
MTAFILFKKFASKSLLSAIFLIVLQSSVHAGINMYMRITSNTGALILGESQSITHLNQVDILAWSGASSACPVGTAGGCLPITDPFSFTKYLDRASNPLKKSLYLGQTLNEVVFYCENAMNQEFLRITMTDVSVTNISSGGGVGEDRFTENFSLDAKIIKWTYTRLGSTPLVVSEFTYNRYTNTGF